MSYNEDEELEVGFKGVADEDEFGEPLETPEGMSDLDLDGKDLDEER